MWRKGIVLLLAVVFTFSVLYGCSATGSKASEGVSKGDMAMANTADKAKFDGKNGGNESGTLAPKEQEAAMAPEETKALSGTSSVMDKSITGNGAGAQSSMNVILSQRKIIRNAIAVIEVEDFDAAYLGIKTLVEPYGFIQESSIKKEKVFFGKEERLLTRGTIVLRVDRTRFDSILDNIGGLGLLLDLSIKSDDVTDKFYDVESELRLLKYEQQRLEEYLHKLTDPDTIFKTESRLTDIRHQIEGLTGTLNKLSDLVQLSTITVTIHEKGKVSAVPVVKEKTYWQRLGDSFIGSVKGVVDFCGELLLLFVQALPALVLLAVLCLILWRVFRKYFRNRTGNNDKDNNHPM